MRTRLKAGVALVGLGLSLGLALGPACCPGGPPPSNGGAGTSRRTSSSSGTGGTAAGSGSTTGGPGSCNAYPGSCPPPGTLAPLDNCRSDQVELVANLVDSNFANSSEDITCPILLTDVYDAKLSVSTDLCGYIRYCVAPGTQISFSAQVDAYLTVNFATLVVSQSTQVLPGVPMAKTALLNDLRMYLPDIDTSLPMVVVEVQPVNPSPGPGAGQAAQRCASAEGWAVWLVDSSGGQVDAGIAYLNGNTLDTTAGKTDPTGFVLFYNVDPGLQTVQPRALRPRDLLPDGGVWCGNPEGRPPLGFIGSVPIGPNEVSVIPYIEGPN
jgi:hypothetical protein